MAAASSLPSLKADVRVKISASFVICVKTSRKSFLFSVGEELRQITSTIPEHMRPLILEAIKQETGVENEIAQITDPSAAPILHVVANGMQNDLLEAALHGTADARHQGAASKQQTAHKQQKQIIKYDESDVSNLVTETNFSDPPADIAASPNILPAAAAMPLADAHAGEWRQAPQRLLQLDPNENQRRQQPVLNPGHVHFWLPPFPDPRLWSAAVDPADTYSTYTIRTFLGDPDAPLLHLRTQTKCYLQGLLRKFGFDDISGTRAALLQRFQAGNYGIPFVVYRIDSRECL